MDFNAHRPHQRLSRSERALVIIAQDLAREAISPHFVHRIVQDYGDAAIAATFLIPRESGHYYLEYLLRRFKGPFYRNRYPNITLVDD